MTQKRFNATWVLSMLDKLPSIGDGTRSRKNVLIASKYRADTHTSEAERPDTMPFANL